MAHPTRLPCIRLEPRLHDGDAARVEMRPETPVGARQRRGIGHVSDGAEEAHDGVEALTEVEASHVGAMQRDLG